MSFFWLATRASLLILLGFLLSACSEKTGDDYIQEGIEFTNQERYDDALQAFQRAVQASPKDPEAYYGLGGIYNYQERYQEAAEAFETAIRLDPTHHNSYYSLGYTYEQLGRNQEAEKKYRKYRDLKARYDQLMKHQREKR